MSNESERWNRLKTDLMNIKFNEVDQNTLRDRVFIKFRFVNFKKNYNFLFQNQRLSTRNERQFEFVKLPNGFVRVLFLGTRASKFAQHTG